MNLTERQRKALTGLIDIGFERTSAALSDLTGHQVRLGVAEVAFHSVRGLARALFGLASVEVATVHQIFAGPMTGDALLLIGHEGALRLINLLTNNNATIPRLDASTREALTEVGNILLNDCLEVFGNLLQAKVSFSIPSLYQESLDAVLRSVVIGKQELRRALVVHTTFWLRNEEVPGYLIIVPDVASLDQLVKEAENWRARR